MGTLKKDSFALIGYGTMIAASTLFGVTSTDWGWSAYSGESSGQTSWATDDLGMHASGGSSSPKLGGTLGTSVLGGLAGLVYSTTEGINPGEILVVIFSKKEDCTPYSSIEKCADKVFNTFSKEKHNNLYNEDLLIFTENDTVFNKFSKVFDISRRSKLINQLDLLQKVLKESQNDD